MKKKIIITIIVLLVLVPSCYFAYKYFTKEEESVKTDKLKLAFKDKMPRVDASLATQPLMNDLVEYLAGNDALKVVKENYTNTHPGYVKLVNGETDLLIVTEPSKEELELAKKAKVELEVTKVVNEAFVFFVNTKNKVNNIELQNIVDIYSGKITNWREVGGNDAKIIAYQRPVNSGSQTGILSLVMKGVEMKKPTTKEMIETMGGIVDIVADYDNNIDGLGYSYYYYANVMYTSPYIKFLSINGVNPTYDTIESEEYPIMTAYYIVTRKDANENTLKFKDAILSSEGKRVSREAGYVPTK